MSLYIRPHWVPNTYQRCILQKGGMRGPNMETGQKQSADCGVHAVYLCPRAGYPKPRAKSNMDARGKRRPVTTPTNKAKTNFRLWNASNVLMPKGKISEGACETNHRRH